MSGDQSNRGQYDTNAPIITTDSGRIYRPKNLLNAISEIQQFYVIESKGQNIPAEFLTLDRTIDFFKIGIKCGFHEGFALTLLFPVFHFYLFPFVFHQGDLFSRLLFSSIPYLVLVINTGMCCYISRYYIGNLTRRAINSLLMGRVLSLLVKAFLLYVFYLFLQKLSTPENVWKLLSQIDVNAEKIYHGFFTIKPYLLPVATKYAIIMAIAAVIPYGSAFVLDALQRYRIRRNQREISA